MLVRPLWFDSPCCPVTAGSLVTRRLVDDATDHNEFDVTVSKRKGPILSRVGRKSVREKEPTRFFHVRVVTVQSQDSFSNKTFALGYIGNCLNLLIGFNSTLTIK
jgi:hypothetical protein